MLRKDSSFREISVSDSLEHKSFLNLARKPSSKLAFHQAAKMLDSNKENTARTYSESTKDFFFKKDIKSEKIPYESCRFQSTKTYLECRLEQLDQRKKTQTPTLNNFTPVQNNKQASQERYQTSIRKQSVNTSNNMKPTNQQNNEFNIYKQLQPTSIPSSYLDQSVTQRTAQKVNTSPERPTMPTQKQYYITSIIKAFKNKGGNAAKEHLIQQMQGVIICQKIKIPIPKKSITLPPTDRKTIIFDLDETLVHCNSSSFTPGDVLLNITFENGDTMEVQKYYYKASINIRPYTQHLLQSLSRHFEIIVFTASQSSYANAVLDYLDPTRRLIHHRFYREHCIAMEGGHFIKDLRIFNRKLEDVLIVDNAPHSYLYQLNNGIPIIPYIDNKTDEELKSLLQYLMPFRFAKDVRELNAQQLKLHRFAEYDDPNDLLKTEFYEYQ